MSNAYRAWKASFTRRWHSNYDLCDTLDYVSGHQQRVALLMLALKPDVSRVALIHAITHDQGEMAAGDWSRLLKKGMPLEVYEHHKAAEDEEIAAQFGSIPNLTVRETDLLRLCDWLDAWLWMMRNARHLYARVDWQVQKADTLALADRLGLDEEVEALIHEAEQRS